jgi:putative FmdB family regulatory protein
MATYEYVCMGCEHLFEEERSMTASVGTALACPSCGSDRVKRRFSVFAAGTSAPGARSVGGGCGCGGACACGH